MTIDEELKQMAGMTYPGRVDVVEGVMAEVMKHPYLRPVRRSVQPWQRIVSTTVAAAVVALVVNVIMVRMNSYDEAGIGQMISQVQEYDYYGSTVEDGAVNPYEYLYNEYEY